MITCAYNQNGDLSDLATLLSNARKKIVMVDSVYAKIRFAGEIESLEIDRKNGLVHMQAVENIRVMRQTPTGYNPVSYKGSTRRVWANAIFDHDAQWTVNEFQGKVITFLDSSLYETITFPTAVSVELYNSISLTWVPATPSTVAGNIEYLYYNDNEHDTGNVIGYHQVNQTPEFYNNIRAAFDFDFYEKSDPQWDKIELQISVKFTSLRSSRVNGIGAIEDANRPKIHIYDYRAGVWDLIYDFKDDSQQINVQGFYESAIEAADDGAAASPQFVKKINILEALGVSVTAFKLDYLDDLGVPDTPNNSGFYQRTVKIRVSSNHVANSAMDPKMEVAEMRLSFTQHQNPNPDERQEQGSGSYIITSNDANSITVQTNGATIPTGAPHADGITVNDNYTISESILDVLAAIFAANSDWTLTIDIDQDLTTVSESTDTTYTPIYDLLQKYCARHNMTFWSISTATVNDINLTDKEESTGITITEADILEYKNGGLTVTFNHGHTFNQIVVIGFDGITKALPILEDYESSISPKTMIIRNNELNSQKEVDDYAISQRAILSKKKVTIEFTINISNPIQNYAALEVGKTILLECDEYSSSDDGALFIEGITYMKLNDNAEIETLTLFLMRRLR